MNHFDEDSDYSAQQSGSAFEWITVLVVVASLIVGSILIFISEA